MKKVMLTFALFSLLTAAAFADRDHRDREDRKDKPHITGDAMTTSGFAAAGFLAIGTYFVLRRRVGRRRQF